MARALIAPERAVLVSLDLGDPDQADSLEELKRLTESARAVPLAVVTGRRHRPDAALFAGQGKVEEIAAAVAAHGADVVIFNHALSASQQRNLENRLKCRVVDRVSLILDIFAQRAKSHEGKLQVELAQLTHLATRLKGGWTHLERQKGGIGLRGPGETQLETDRRLVAQRVKLLRSRLERLARQRQTQRRARARRDVFSVSIVGYTNAGKSTLFNRLTGAEVLAADRLFATLDTTSRRIFLPGAGPVVLSDTVGFIKHLPHSLIEAFRATLEEAAQADLLLHVVDAASPIRDAQIAQVDAVLAEIGAGAIPRILVYNKIDASGHPPGLARDECGNIARVWLSAVTGAGIEALRQALDEAARGRRCQASSPHEAAAVQGAAQPGGVEAGAERDAA